MMQTERLTPGVLIVRFFTALLLVYATFNPEGHSYFHWAVMPVMVGDGVASIGPLKLVTGIILLMAWLVFLHATRRSLGILRAVLLLAITGEIVMLVIDQHLGAPSNTRGATHAALLVVSLVLTLGLSWTPVLNWLRGRAGPDHAS
jgi:hypothetical protein